MSELSLINEDPRLHIVLEGHKKPITSISFNPNHAQFASSSEDKCIMIWTKWSDSQTGPSYRFNGHADSVTGVEFSPDCKILASCSKDHNVRFWVPKIKGGHTEFRAHTSSVNTLNFSSDGAKLITGSNDKSVKLWDVTTRQFISSYIGHNNWVRCARFSPENNMLVSCSDDRTIRIWDTANGDLIHAFTGATGSPKHVAMHLNNNSIAVAMNSGSVRIYDIRNRKLQQHYKLHDETTCVDWHPHANYLLSSGKDGKLILIDILEGRPLFTVGIDQSPLLTCKFSTDGDYFASGGQNANLQVWKTNFICVKKKDFTTYTNLFQELDLRLGLFNVPDKVAFQTQLIQDNLNLRITFAPVDEEWLEKIAVESYEKVTYLLDLSCDNSKNILEKASNTKKFVFQYSWAIFAQPNQTSEDIFNIFANIKTRIDMDVKIFIPTSENATNFYIFEVYNRGVNDNVNIREFGLLEDGKINVNSKESESFYERRKDMKGIMIRSANVIKYKFKSSFEEYMNDPKLRIYDIYSKFHYQMFLVLRDVHGFSYNTSLRPSWFGNKSSGEDGGIAKMLHDDTADVTSAGNIMRLLETDRIDFYDFIMPYYKFRYKTQILELLLGETSIWKQYSSEVGKSLNQNIHDNVFEAMNKCGDIFPLIKTFLDVCQSCFYFRNPGVVKPNFYEVLKPFANKVWYSSLVTILVVCVCIEITRLAEKKLGTDINSQTWYTSVFVVIAVFSQQGLSVLPKHSAGRIIILSLLICSVLLYNYYTSSLVSSLISTEPEVLKTIKELYESNLKVGIELQPYMITYMLDRSKQDHYLFLLNSTKIYEKGVPNYLTVPDGLEKVHHGGFAYHTESIAAYPLIASTFEQESICDLAEIPLIIGDTSIMAQKKSQYKKLFQISLRKMWQSGILKKLYKTWVGNKPECLSSARVISVAVNDLFLPYFLLVLGVATSLMILMMEMVSFRIRNKYTRNQEVYPFVN